MNSNINIYIPVTNEAGIGNTLKGFITGLSITDNCIIVNNYNSILGNYSSVLDGLHIGDNLGKESFSTCRFLILKEEESEQPDLVNEFSNDKRARSNLDNLNLWPMFSEHFIDWYYDRSLICDKAFNRILLAISKIKWNDIVLNEVNKYSIPQNTLAVSVRTWTAPHEHNIQRSYSTADYINSIIKMTSENNISNVFISYDNINIKNEYSNFLEKYNIIEYIKPSHITELQYAVIKMLLLAKCEYLICNRISTYSELVFWFSKCTQKVLHLY